MRRVIVTDRRDAPLFELAEADVFELRRDEEVNGEHALTITTTRVLREGWRVLMEDARGVWREWVVYSSDALHESGARPIGTYYCAWSLMVDLMGTRVSRMPGVQSPVAAAVALEAALSGTSRWSVGTVTQTATGGASMYDMSGWDAMSVLVANWGGEVDARVDVGANLVISRQCCLYSQQGEQAAKRRFDFGADLASVRRAVAPGPLYCRIAPRGRGEATEGGGYGRKVTIESVNDGKDYLENAAMVELAKLPDGAGGWEYPTLEVENPQCETPAELLAWAQGVVEESTLPKVTYEVDGIQAAAEGVDVQGVSLGDAVHVVDAKFDGLRLEGRALAISTDELIERNVELRIGSLSKGVSDILGVSLGGLRADVSAIEGTVKAMNGGTMSTADYLTRLLDRLNEEINAGGGYTYIVPGHGILTYDVAVADPLSPAEASNVVEIKGGTIRIADTKTAQGEWEWKTVILSGRLAAEVVTSANLVSGFIGSPSGNYWNLDTGELRMAATTPIVGTEYTVSDVVNGMESTVTGVAVEFNKNQSSQDPPAESDPNWSTDNPTWEAGKYIWQRVATTTASGTDYSDPVCISGRDGATGTNAAAIYLYARASTAPTKNMADPLTYTFASGALTGSLGSWSRNIPSGTDTCWVVMATAISNSATDTIARSEWSDPVALSSAGVDGLNQATVFLFQKKKAWRFEVDELIAPDSNALSFSGTNATINGTFDGTNLVLASDAPAKPSVQTTYTFADGTLSPIPTGWSRSVPEGDDPCYVTSAAAISASATDTIAASEWADVAKLSEDGIAVTVHSIMYAVGSSGTTAPTSGWQSTVPATQQGRWLWCRTTYTDGTTSDTCSYMGADGQDGTSVMVQSSTKTGGVTTVKLVDSDGHETTLSIADGEDGEQGVQGPNGKNIHIAWANSADGTDDFSTSVSEGKSYIGVYDSADSADSQEPSDYSWSRIRGEDGINHATINLYQRASSSPAKPSATLTYYFATDTLSGSLGSWSRNIPSGTSPCWVIAATAASQGANDTIASAEWSTPVKLVENGATGAAGLNQATVYLYRRAASAPSSPSSSVTYTFATGQLSSVPSGWSRTVPSGTNPCWVTTAVAISNGATDTIASSEWATPTKMVENGAKGDTGVGVSSYVPQWYLSTSSSSATGSSEGWVTNQPEWASGKYLWERTKVTYDNGTVDYVPSEGGMLAASLNKANSTAKGASDAVTALDGSLNQQGVFNRLTNNGAAQGVYIENGQLYVNATYIVSGQLRANLITSGKIQSANGKVYFDLDNNELRCDRLISTDSTNYAIASIESLWITNTQKENGLRLISGSYDDGLLAIVPSKNTTAAGCNFIKSKNIIEIFAGDSNRIVSGAYNGGCSLRLSPSSAHLMTDRSGVSGFSKSGYVAISTKTLYLQAESVQDQGDMSVSGSLTVTGTKSRLARTGDFSDRLLYAYETPSPLFGDVGSGTIGPDGLCYVEIDAIFAEAARVDFSYQVFLQKCGQGDLWVAEKEPTHFVVEGTPGLAFDWELKARQVGFELLRMEDNALAEKVGEPDGELGNPEDAYGDYIAEIEQLLAA